MKLNLLSVFNSSNNIKDYESTLEYIFKKDDTKYDIIFYDKIHSKKFGSYLLDLQDFIPEEIKEYDSKYIFPICYYKSKLVGLVI